MFVPNYSVHTFSVNFAKSGPFAECLVITNLEDWDLVFDAEGLDESDVVCLVAVFGQNTIMKI